MLTITTNNLVSLDDRYVGRIHKADAHPKSRSVRFYTAGDGATFDVERVIDVTLYTGGPSDWQINPAFEAAVRGIVG